MITSDILLDSMLSNIKLFLIRPEDTPPAYIINKLIADAINTMKLHSIQKDGTRMVRFNCNIPESNFIRFHALAKEMDISMTRLIVKFIENFDKIINFDEKKYK